MIVTILIFAALISLSGLTLMFAPKLLENLLAKKAAAIELHVLAVGVRLLIGTLLVMSAGVSRYPVIMHWLGWIAIVAAIVLAVMGRQRFISLMRWALGLVGRIGRVAGLFAAAFGGFIIYAYT